MDSNTDEKVRYRELAALKRHNGRTWMVRRHFVCANDPTAIERFREEHGNVDLYTSVGQFVEPRLDAPATVPLFFDIDAEGDLEAARVSTLQIGERLFERLQIPQDMLQLFFSGHKGFHVVAPLVVFANIFLTGLVGVWRSLANRLTRDGVKHIDLGVYQNNRLFRLVNSKHSVSGLYKVPLEWAELQDLGLDHVLEVARQPREYESMAETPTEIPQALGWLQEALAWRKQHHHAQRQSRQKLDDARGWRIPPCIRRIEEGVTLDDGQRHAMYFHIARIYAGASAHPVEIAERLKTIDQRNPIKDSTRYIERVAHNAGKYTGYFQSCPHELFEQYCDPTRYPFSHAPQNRETNIAAQVSADNTAHRSSRTTR